MDKRYFLKLREDQGVEDVEDVYFVAQMSSNLPMEEKYIGNAGKFFERPEYIIESGESILFEIRCDLSVKFLDLHPQPLSQMDVNKGMAQAALGSLLAQHPHEDSGKQTPLIMPETHRAEITTAMSEFESLHDRHN